MSREIDERVVQMRFDSREFNRNIQESVNNLNSLKKNLNFESASKGFEDLDKQASKLRIRFTLLDNLAWNVMNRISNAIIGATHAAKNLVTALSFDQINPGWEKYANKTSSVQTIMAATAAQFSDTAEQMEVVNEQLSKLNWFTDETSYNFVDMVNNIGKFTSNNIALDKSVTAMQGIANWAAISGANAQEASRAMYNLAQALATGAVTLIDWKSIENANMATTEFKQTVIDMAVEMGTLQKTADGAYKTLKGTAVSVSNFNTSLSEKWFNSDILMGALEKYGSAADKLNALYENLDGSFTTSTIIKDIDKYVAALNKAGHEVQELELTNEDATKHIEKATTEVTESIADKWGVSIEQAREWLDQFGDDATQFSLKAFKAAQEAKTFAEAIDSVKDAVSTGWMNTFELVFGDYTHAKEFWTNIANALYDIFAAGGDARNDMLEDWAEMGGRAQFIDTIYAGLAQIFSILTAIKSAWNSVFGSVTAQALYNLTVKLHDFVVNMVLTEDGVQKLARVFRGLFAILDIIKTILGTIIKGVLSVFQRVLGELNIDFGELAATIGDFIYMVSLWIKQSGILDAVIGGIADIIVNLVKQVKIFIKNLSNWGPVQAAIKGLRSMIGENFKGIGSIFTAFINIIRWVWDQLRNFKFPTSLSDVFNFFKMFAQTIRESFESIGINFGWLDGIFSRFSRTVHGALEKVNAGFNNTLGLIGNLVEWINKAFKDVDWAGVILVAFGVGTLAILWKFADALSTIAKGLELVNDIGKSTKAAVDSITGYFKALKANLKTNNFVKIAIGITLLSVAFGHLATLNWAQLWNGIKVMGALAVVCFTLSLALGALDKLGFNAKGLTSTLLGIAAMVGALGIALRLIPDDIESVQNKVIAIIEAITMIELVFTVCGIIAGKFGGEAVNTSIKSIIGLVFGVITLIGTLKKLSKEDVSMISAASPVIIVLMVALGLIAKAMTVQKRLIVETEGLTRTEKYGGSFGNVIGIIVGIIGLIHAIKMLGKMDFKTALKGIALGIPIMAALLILFKASARAGAAASSAGKMMLSISIALGILIPVIYAFANIPEEVFTKGANAIALLSAALILPLIAVSKYAGKDAAKAGLMILEVAGALAIIQLVIKTLGRVDYNELSKGTTAVIAVVLSLATVIKSLNKSIETKEEDVKALNKILIMIGIISAVIFLLTLINPEGALFACAGMSAMFVAIGYMFKLINNVKPPNNKSLIAITAALGVLATVLTIVSSFADWKGTATVFIGMSAMILSLGFMFKRLDNIELPNTKKIFGIVSSIGLLASIVTILSNAIQDKWKEALAITAGMSLVILTIGSLSQILKNSATSPALEQKLNSLTKFAYAIVGVLAGLGMAAALTKTLGGNVSDIAILATAMSELIIAIGIMGKLLGKLTIPSTASIKPLLIISGVIATIAGIIAVVIAAFNYKMPKTANFDGLLVLITALSEIMIALGYSISLMSEVDLSKLSWDKLLIMAVITGALGAVVAGLLSIQKETPNILAAVTFTASLSAIMLAIAKAIQIIDGVEVEYKTIGTLGLVALICAVFGAILIALFQAMNGMEPNLLTAITFVGSLSILMIALAYVAKIISAVPAGSLQGALEGLAIIAIILAALGGLTAIIAALVDGKEGGATEKMAEAVEVMHQLGKGIGIFFGGILEGFAVGVGRGLVALMQAVCDSLVILFQTLNKMPDGIVQKIIELTAAFVVMTGAEFVAAISALPGIGGLMESGAEALKTRFRDFGKALIAFSRSIEDLSNEDLERVSLAADALFKLGTLEESLVSFKRVFASILGLDDLEGFGYRLQSLGVSLTRFSNSTKNVNEDTVNRAVNCAQTLKTLEEDLPNINGVLAFLFGEDSLDKFGNRIVEFGAALANFTSVASFVDQETVEKAKLCGETLAELEDKLNPYGGFQGMIFGKQDLGQFGLHLEQFGTGLYKFWGKVVDLIPSDFDNVVEITESLIDVQKKIESQGGVKGFWFGDNSFKSFGDSLQSFGNTLAAFSGILARVNFGALKQAINYVEDLIGLNDIGQAQTDAVFAAQKILSLMSDAFETNFSDMQLKGNLVIFWIVKGMEEGTNSYSARVANCAKTLAQEFIDAFEAALEIHSPSLVMNEEGHYIVQGLAEGINVDTSAEEAARQKASNIVSAFESELSKLTTAANIRDLDFQLWQITEGKYATTDEVSSRQYNLEMQKFDDLVKTVSARRVAMEKAAEIAGEESDAYKKAQQDYLQSQIDLEKQRQLIIDTYGPTGTVNSELAKFASEKETHTIEFELWKVKEGLYASEQEIMQKELELEMEDLAYLSKTISSKNIELQRILEQYGEGSAQYQEKFNEVMKAETEARKKMQSINEKYGVSNAAIDPRNQAKEFAAYVKNNQKTYEMLGMSMDELYEAASQHAYNMSYVEMQQRSNYNALIANNSDLINLLDWSEEQLEKWARDQSGWQGANQTLTGIAAQTAKTLEDNMNYFSPDILNVADQNIDEMLAEMDQRVVDGLNYYSSVDWQATMDQCISDIAEKAKKSAGSAGASAGSAFSGGFFDEVEKQFSEDSEEEAKGLGQILMEAAQDVFSGEAVDLGQTFSDAFYSTAFGEFISNIDPLKNRVDECINSPSIETLGGIVDGGKEVIGNTIDGISGVLGSEQTRSTITAATNTGIVDPGVEAMEVLGSKAEEAGESMPEGMAQGIHKALRKGNLTAALDTMTNSANNRLRSNLQINSPSKVTMVLGEAITEGVAVGIGNKINMVENSIDDLTKVASSSLDYASEAINSILSADDDYRPVISPVLDLDELADQASDIPGLLNANRSISLTTSKLKVGSISSDKSVAANQNGSNTTTQTYNFTQNNYSPKALSRSEIYRQTNNQFSRLKEATKR